MDARRWPVREECLLTEHILLKAWKVTVVGMECDDSAFQRHFRMVHKRLLTIHKLLCVFDKPGR